MAILNPSQLSSARIIGSTSRLYYPSPFFDIASTYLPKNIKELFQWCRYYFLTHPIIHQCVTKMAEYPVTDVIIEDDDQRISNKWQELLNDKFDFKGFLISIGLDYSIYGNAYVGPLFPFTKYLTCQGCKEAFPANTIMEKWTFSNYSFTLECPKCKRRGKADAKDIYTKNIEKVKLFCWNPESILVNGSEFGGSHYFYQVPSHVKNDWALGQKYKVVETPQEILDASLKSKIIILNKDNFIHLKRTASSGRDYEYGVPLMFPVLKDIFLFQIFKKATECLTPDTLVECYEGWKPAKDMDIGDLVKSHTGVFRRVSDKWSKIADKTYKITLSGLPAFPVTMTGNHPVLCASHAKFRSGRVRPVHTWYIRNHPERIKIDFELAENLSKKTMVAYPRRKFSESPIIVDLGKYCGKSTDLYIYKYCKEETGRSIEKEEVGLHVKGVSGKVARRMMKKGTVNRFPRYHLLNEDLAYILGWYTGDGSTNKRNITFNLGLKDDEIYLSEVLKKVMGKESNISRSKKAKMNNLVLGDVRWAEIIRGWISGKAPKKRIPTEIFDSPKSVALAYLKGLFQADGCLKQVHSYSLTTTSTQVALGTWRMLSDLGILSTIDRSKPHTCVWKNITITGKEDILVVSIHGESYKKFKDLITTGKSVIENVSGKTGLCTDTHILYRIGKILKTKKDQEVINISVEDDHTFCIPGMATHNSLLLDHAVPLRVIFPQASSAAADPNIIVKLRTWRTEIEENLTRWRQDPNYISVLPFPLGQETIGGDAKVFLFGGELLQQMEMVIVGMGVPKEFILGGTSFSGSNMSLKMLENTFVNYRLMLMRLTRFTISKLAAYTGWPKPKNVRFRNFKMADDLQRKMYFLQLNQMKKISDTTLLDDNDMSSEVEDARIEKEISRRRQSVKNQAIAEAEVQTEVQGMVQKHQVKTQMDLQKYQQRLQEEYNETLKPAQDIKGNVGNIMQRISGMAPEEQATYMERLQASHPDLAGIVTTMQEKMKATGQGESLMQPMPEVLPPRRLAQ